MWLSIHDTNKYLLKIHFSDGRAVLGADAEVSLSDGVS